MSFNPDNIMIASIPLMLVVFGLTELVKDWFGITGKYVNIFAVCIGGVLFALYQVTAILPLPWADYYTIFITSITFGLTSGGYYKFVDNRWPKVQ